jgi:hypothetical protein
MRAVSWTVVGSAMSRMAICTLPRILAVARTSAVNGPSSQPLPNAVSEHVGSVETVVTSAAQSAAKVTVRSLRPLAR